MESIILAELVFFANFGATCNTASKLKIIFGILQRNLTTTYVRGINLIQKNTNRQFL